MAELPKVSRSPFLELPREMRDKIYSYALTPLDGPDRKPQARFAHDTYIIDPDYVVKAYMEDREKVAWKDLPKRIRKVNVPGISIIYTSKQIYDEATVALYGTIPFRLQCRSGVEGFLVKIGRENASKIRHLILSDDIIGIPFFSGVPWYRQEITDCIEVCQRPIRKAIRNFCTGLTTLEIDCYPIDFDFEHDEPLHSACFMLAVNRHIVKAIPTLRSTTVTMNCGRKVFYNEYFARFARYVVHDLGWRIKLVKYDTLRIKTKYGERHVDVLVKEETIGDLEEVIHEATVRHQTTVKSQRRKRL